LNVNVNECKSFRFHIYEAFGYPAFVADGIGASLKIVFNDLKPTRKSTLVKRVFTASRKLVVLGSGLRTAFKRIKHEMSTICESTGDQVGARTLQNATLGCITGHCGSELCELMNRPTAIRVVTTVLVEAFQKIIECFIIPP
jgi:hypothetical protein